MHMDGTNRGVRARRAMGVGLSLAVLAGVAVVAAPEVGAFKPFTHNQSAFDAWQDVTDDGMVTIGDQEYAAPDKVVDALTAWPSYYNAGVIGPDGFPDLTMGQSVIHPENTGQWLTHLLDEAWAAQDDVFEPGSANPADNPANPSYTDAEEGQILAFTYGFLTHAAGDMWAHTMVNELSEGIFPGVGDILTDADMAAIALRHLLVEGYVGAATSGFDNDPNEAVLGGDVSDDSTPGVPMDAPIRFVYDALIDPTDASMPTSARGPVISFFLGLRGQLNDFLTSTPNPLGVAIAQYEEFKNEIEALFDPAQCDGIDNDGDGDVDEGCIFPYSEDEDNSGPCSFGVGDTVAGAIVDIVTDTAE